MGENAIVIRGAREHNLKNIDLETLAADDDEMSGVGNPISIEMLNEDELRRLILVQLARLSVKQEWDGLLG